MNSVAASHLAVDQDGWSNLKIFLLLYTYR